MLQTLVRLTQGVNFVRAVVWVIFVTPAILTWLAGYLEGQPWSVLIVCITLALGGGVILAWGGIKVIDLVRSHFTDKATKERIWKQIKEYMDSGGSEIDTLTAAGIWAGTMDDKDVQRLVYFRMIKLAIDRGEIKECQYADQGRKANKLTRMPFDQFINYLKRRGVLDQ